MLVIGAFLPWNDACRVIFLWKFVTDLGFTVIFRTLKQEEQHAHEVHCSRERSRAAWKIIEEVTYKYFL